MTDQKIVYHLNYGYHGASCTEVTTTEDHGWIEAKNSYNEPIFSGNTSEFFKFMVDLSAGKYV